MNFIEELYYENVNPCIEHCATTARYEQATEIVSKITTKLKDSLTEPENTMLKRLIEADNEITEETGMLYFKIGFSLGVQMMVDCLSMNIDKIVTNN